MNIRKVILLAEIQKGAFGNVLGKTCAYAFGSLASKALASTTNIP
jgi:hypothetical protein